MWNIITILKNRFLFECILKCNLFLWCKAEFSASSLQSSVLRDSAEIIPTCRFAAQETFLIFINVENSCAVFFIFVETVVCIFESLINTKLKAINIVVNIWIR